MTNSAIDEGYPIFVPDQILSSQDLNAVVDYCKSRSLLTRSQLIGQGIVRGLVVSANPQTAQITVSPGVGISADGQLITLSEPVTLAYYETASPSSAIKLFQQPGTHRLTLRQFKENDTSKAVVERTDVELNRFFQTHVLVVSSYPRVVTRTASLLSYSAVGKDLKFELQFFLLPQAEITASEEKSHLIPFTLRRFGYQSDTSEATVRLAAITTYDALKTNYETLCREAIEKTVSAAVQELPERMKRLPGLSDHLPQFSPPTVLQPLQPLLDSARAQDGLQYFYDYLNQIAAAYRELADGVFEYTMTRDCPSPPVLKAPMPDLSSYLLLGTVQLPDETASLSLKYFSTRNPYRHHFIPQPLQSPATLHQINRISYLYARLLRLCEAESFALPPSTAGAIKITPSVDRSRPLSQQAIPYYLRYENLYPYWNYDAYRKGTLPEHPAYSATSARNPLTDTLDAYSLYRIEGHLGQPHQTVLDQIQALQQQYSLAFEVVALALSDSSEADQVFHRFAETHPGLEHLGGVPKGGTFVIVYVEEQNQDRVIADFALPYRVGPTLPPPPDPTEFSLSLEKTQFRADDLQKYEVVVIPADSTVEGRGILQEPPGVFYFQPSLVGEINQQLTVTIAGKWQGRTRQTQTVTVYALPLAQFRLDDITSRSTSQEEAIVTLGRNRSQVALIPKNQGGRFRAFTKSESGEVNQDSLIQQNPPAVILSQLGDIEEFTVEYTFASEVGNDITRITVQIHQDEDGKHNPTRLPFRLPTHLTARIPTTASPSVSPASETAGNSETPIVSSSLPQPTVSSTSSPSASTATDLAQNPSSPSIPEAELPVARGGLETNAAIATEAIPTEAILTEAIPTEAIPTEATTVPETKLDEPNSSNSLKQPVRSVETNRLGSQPSNNNGFGMWGRFLQLVTKPIG